RFRALNRSIQFSLITDITGNNINTISYLHSFGFLKGWITIAINEDSGINSAFLATAVITLLRQIFLSF
ncbi:hypothetical protein ACFL6Z_12540, partial [Pseudomonadota bacterium]